MKTSRVDFANADGKRLAALLDLPEDERPAAFAVFAHCFTCGKNLKGAANIARSLSRQRIGVLRLDFTGLGESEGDFAETSLSSDVRDLAAAALFLQENYQSPRLLVGHSFGGAAALLAAGEIPSVSAVATIAAPFHPEHVLRLLGEGAGAIEEQGRARVRIAGREFTLSRGFLDDLRSQRPEETLRRLRAALLVLHSPRDQVVGIDQAAAIYQAAKHPKSFISLDPADHLLSAEEDSRYAGSVIGIWAGRYLQIPLRAEKPVEVIDNRVTVRTGPEGFRTDIFANGYPLVADEPEEYGGTDRGPSPYEYLLAALGACTGMTVQMYARRKRWPLESAVVRLRHHKVHAEDCRDCDEKDARIDQFERELELRGDLDEAQRRRLLAIAEKCPVHRTLTEEVRIETRLRED